MFSLLDASLLSSSCRTDRHEGAGLELDIAQGLRGQGGRGGRGGHEELSLLSF